MKTILITASSTNDVIGQDNAIPWYLPEDLKQFKKMTVGNGNNSVVMGRKTFDSLDRKILKGRVNFVWTNQKQKFITQQDNLIFVNSIDEIYDEHRKRNLENVFIIGGSEIYKIFLQTNKIDEIYFLGGRHH